MENARRFSNFPSYYHNLAYKNQNSVGYSSDKNSKKKRTQSVSKLNSYVAVYRIGRKAF